MSTSKRIMINSSFLYLKMILTLFITLYTTRILLEALGKSDFGLFNVIAGFTIMLTFFNIALTTSSQRFMSVAQGEGVFSKQISIFNISIVLHMFAAILIAILLKISGLYIFDGFLNIDSNRIESAKIVFNFVILTTVFGILSVPFDASINAHEKMIFIAILGFCEAILNLSVALIIVNSDGDKLILYGILLSIVGFFILICKIVYVLNSFHESIINPIKYYDKSLFKEMLNFSGWGLLSSSVSIVTSYGQNILINIFFGTHANAAQGIAGQVAGQVGAITKVFLIALNPVIFKSEGASNKGLFLQSIKSGSKVAFMSFSILAIPMIIEMELLFKLWLKEVPEYAIIFCRLILVTYILGQLTITVSSAISATGKIKNFTIAFSLLGMVPFAITYLLFKNGYSVESLYITYLNYEFFRTALLLYFGKIVCEISIRDYFKDVIFKCLLIAITTALTLLFIRHSIFESIFRVGLVFLASFVLNAVLYFAWGFSLSEKEVIKKLYRFIQSLIINKLRGPL